MSKFTHSSIPLYLTFDDVLIVPAYSEVVPSATSLKTRLTQSIELSIPLLSAAMDTVTESRMAVKMAQLGGMGIIHKNMSPDEQARQVSKVKNFEGGVIKSPINLTLQDTLGDYFQARRHYEFSSFPIVTSKDSLKLEGFVSEKDVKFLSDPHTPLADIMTPRRQLVTVSPETPPKHSRELMNHRKIEQVLVVDDKDCIVGMVSSQGLVEAHLYTEASRDSQARLMVGAAIGTGQEELERIEKLVDAGVDVIVVDTAHGHSKNVGERVKYLKKTYPSIQVIAGNIATGEAAEYLIDCGADAIKVGIGAGSICTTRIVAGVGVPQLQALLDVQKVSEKTGIPFIADGGLRQSGDIAKALAGGAHTAMLGSLVAGTHETPGNLISHNGQNYKEYRGMGSLGAMVRGSADRYAQGHIGKQREKLVPEGVESRVLYKGKVETILYQLLGGLRASMGYTGSATIQEFHEKARFVQITNAGLSESHVHSVQMMGDSPNYRSL